MEIPQKNFHIKSAKPDFDEIVLIHTFPPCEGGNKGKKAWIDGSYSPFEVACVKSKTHKISDEIAKLNKPQATHSIR